MPRGGKGVGVGLGLLMVLRWVWRVMRWVKRERNMDLQ